MSNTSFLVIFFSFDYFSSRARHKLIVVWTLRFWLLVPETGVSGHRFKAAYTRRPKASNPAYKFRYNQLFSRSCSEPRPSLATSSIPLCPQLASGRLATRRMRRERGRRGTSSVFGHRGRWTRAESKSKVAERQNSARHSCGDSQGPSKPTACRWRNLRRTSGSRNRVEGIFTRSWRACKGCRKARIGPTFLTMAVICLNLVLLSSTNVISYHFRSSLHCIKDDTSMVSFPFFFIFFILLNWKIGGGY